MKFVIIGLVVVVIALIVWYISTLNGLRQMVLKVEEADSGIDVALTKRFDVLTKMLDIVKEYENYEKNVIVESIRLRSGMSMTEKSNAEKQMNKAFDSIKLTAEAYPQLQASATFNQLQVAVMDTEEHLQAARRAYNANVTAYNNRVVTIPSSVVAGMNGYVKKDYFEAEETKKQDVKMTF